MGGASNNTTRVAPGIEMPDAQLSFSFSKAGGPGGQNVNKVNTRATLTVSMAALRVALPAYALHRLEMVAKRYLTEDGLQISAGDSRSQIANRKACLDRLREVLVQALARPKRRKPTKPSARAVQRRLDAKKHRGKIKSQRGRVKRD
ncbi:MAG: alternative ribosome rescue aminoacyl-tRNA hydrolase ArfB [Phycisphaeraceae bacterium]